ncbi:hypothetical protein [Pseudoxanthomonas suwonensis]|uniref:hypothetical protein n=1 Tax=Pseudoxanthomonas suwonensis TaxID=314722 RepID=UPI000463B436|nr:hypothetical protein [Pseudoxanthomonas suwonensis]
MEALAPLLLALTGLPAVGIAAWYARDARGPYVRGIALRWALASLAIFGGAIGLYFAGGDRTAGTVVVVAMVVAVNALAVSLVMHMKRGDRDTRQ